MGPFPHGHANYLQVLGWSSKYRKGCHLLLFFGRLLGPGDIRPVGVKRFEGKWNKPWEILFFLFGKKRAFRRWCFSFFFRNVVVCFWFCCFFLCVCVCCFLFFEFAVFLITVKLTKNHPNTTWNYFFSQHSKQQFCWCFRIVNILAPFKKIWNLRFFMMVSKFGSFDFRGTSAFRWTSVQFQCANLLIAFIRQPESVACESS